MATLYGTNATKRLVTVPPPQIGPGESYGVVRHLYDIYNVAEDMDGDSVLMGSLLPAGARVLNVQFKTSDLGTGATADVGWQASADGVEAADTDGWISGADICVATTGDTYISSEQLPGAAGIFKKFSSAVQPVVTVTGTTDASGTVELAITYVVD